MEQLLTVIEVAQLVRVDPETVRRWLRKGELKGIKPGHAWRVRKEDLEAFIINKEMQQAGE